ncbi:fimbrial protein FimT [Neisseria weaveri]|uniref:Type II secretion system protein H n=2 Tax=Neisseria weaveri TaxID=28091 RepID=A0A448VQS7_9NEIS|nr:fimbrial protein FimT [Neisseria weaveri]
MLMRLRQNGFTFMELLVVIIIFAIMTVIALPNMSQWIAARRSATQAENMANLLRFARSEAVRLNLPVYVCPVQIKKDGNPDQYCNAAYSGQGVAAFADVNRDRMYTRKDDKPLRHVVINPTQNNRLDYIVEAYDFGKDKPKSGNNKYQAWIFLPDGTFGYSDAKGPKTPIDLENVGTGMIRLILTDKKAENGSEKQARATLAVIENNGRVKICPKYEKNHSDAGSALCKLQF